MQNGAPTNLIYRLFYALDRWISSAFYEIGETFGRIWSAYTAKLEPLRVSGPPRVIVELISDGATLGLIFALGVLYYALPPFSSADDVWNRGREYAVTFTDSSGQIIGRRGIRQDDNIPLKDIPPRVIQAVLSTEDTRFFSHVGVDVQGTVRALLANMQANAVVQGGSTLTQQLAKNLFLTPERTMRRKINEAFLALWIETNLTKAEILKLYLDRSYLGGGTYGVEAASQFYFGKSVRDVNLAEAALLAGLFKAPSAFAPHVNPRAAEARANVVLYRMLDSGYISQGELFEARRNPARVSRDRDIYSPDYFLDIAYAETLRTLLQHGLETEYVVEVKTTIDVELQRHAQAVINYHIDEFGEERRAREAALVSMTPQGALKAVVGGRDYEASQFNRATDALRQPGSSFKPIVYLAALRAGLRPDSVVHDVPISIGNWAPQNYNRRYSGRTTLTNALRHSFNTVPIHLAQKIGREAIIDTARRVGLRSPLHPNASMPLGTNEVTVMDLTTAYAAFANGGYAVEPYSIIEIRRPNGEILFSRDERIPRLQPAIDYAYIADLDYMLHEVIQSGTGRNARLDNIPQAGKTGTTQAYRDAWFLGFTADYVTGVWFGNDDYTPMNRVTGGNLPAQSWKAFMDKAQETMVARALPGIPLEGAYAALMPRDGMVDSDMPMLLTGTEDAYGIRTEADAEPTHRSERSDPVVGVLRSMFSLFGGGGRRGDTVSAEPAPSRASDPPPRERERRGGRWQNDDERWQQFNRNLR